MRKANTNNAPAAVGPYSQATITEDLVFTSGQIGLVPETGKMVEGGIKEQTHQVCRNLKAVLEESGSDLTRVVKTVCFLKDIKDFGTFNEIYAQYFTGLPARSCVEVAALPKDALVEVEVVAELK